MKQVKKIYSRYNEYELKHGTMLILSGLMGALVFLMVYGWRVLDFTNVAWLRSSGGDMTAHYLGWVFYRNTPWQWPIGLLDGITSPYKFSVIYMDSIPLFAFIFKLLSPILPEIFQYFGLFGLLTYVLQGVLGNELIYRFTGKSKESIYGSLIFIFSSTVFQRMFGHTALAFHPIILLCLLVYFSKRDISERKGVLYWALLMILAVSIHAYFFPMVFAFVCAYYLSELISKEWYRALIKIVICLLICFLAMYAWGYFYGTHAMDGGGIGDYNSNLNVLINGAGLSLFGRLIGITATDSIWEAYAYLGLGILMLVTVTLFDIIQKKKFKNFRRKYISTVLLVIIFCIVSIFPIIRFGTYTLFTLNLPARINNLVGIFRSNGRFMWPVMYLIMTAVIVYAIKNFGKRGRCLLLICVVMQILDLTPMCESKSSQVSALLSCDTTLKSEGWAQLDKTDVYFMYDPVGGGPLSSTLAMGTYAIDNGLNMNDFYTSKKDNAAIVSNRNREQFEIFSGNPDDSKIYVFGSVPWDYLRYDTGLNIYQLDGIYIGVTDELTGVEEISIENGLDLTEYTNICYESLIGEDISGHIHSDEINDYLHVGEKITDVIALKEGTYNVKMLGDNFDNLQYDFLIDNAKAADYKIEKSSDNEIEIRLTVGKDVNNVTFSCENTGAGQVVFSEMSISGEKMKNLSYQVEYSEKINFTSDGNYNASPFICSGMSDAEQGFTWTNGNESDFYFVLAEQSDMVTGIINTLGTFNGAQNVEIYVNGQLVSKQCVEGSGDICFEFAYPENGIVNLKLILPDANSPSALNISDDSRNLALMIHTIEFQRKAS